MPISVDWGTKVISIPQSYLTNITGTLYELDTNQCRKDLKSLEDDDEGIAFDDTHRHNTEVTVAGITYSRTIEIINGYSITFEEGQYSVRLAGSNNNFFDIENGILNQNQVQVIAGNSAGLVSAGTALTQEESEWLKILYEKSSGDWTLEGNQLVIYKSMDSMQEVMRFDLFDSDDEPATTNIHKRVRVA